MNEGTFVQPRTGRFLLRRGGASSLRGPASAFVIGVAVCLLAARGVLLADAEAKTAFPRGFREWTHVKTALIGRESEFFETAGGLHHVYANAKAITGLRSGATFPDGAVLAFELLRTVENKGVIGEGARKRVDVMVKDSRSHKDSGGWGFARYVGDDESKDVLTPSHRASCFACHQKAGRRDYVFSQLKRE